MISGVKCVYRNKFAQVYVTDFGALRIYFLVHIREAHTSLSQNFIHAGVSDYLHSENSWEITNIREWKKVMYEDGGIKVSQT